MRFSSWHAIYQNQQKKGNFQISGIGSTERVPRSDDNPSKISRSLLQKSNTVTAQAQQFYKTNCHDLIIILRHSPSNRAITDIVYTVRIVLSVNFDDICIVISHSRCTFQNRPLGGGIIFVQGHNFQSSIVTKFILHHLKLLHNIW